MIGDTLAKLLASTRLRRGEYLRTVKEVRTALRSEAADSPWLADSAKVGALLNATLRTLPSRRPGQTAAPEDRGVRSEKRPPSDKGAFTARIRNILATPAGRMYFNMLPHLSVARRRNMPRETLFGEDGLEFRKLSHVFASSMSHPVGYDMVQLAATLAQRAYSERFWQAPLTYVRRIVVGNGPNGLSHVHGLIDAGDFDNTLVVTTSEVAGGPFAWGTFKVNHRNRPVNPEFRSAPATLGPLDDLGAGLIAPSDISDTWGYSLSDHVAAASALNALSAGPIVRAEVIDWEFVPLRNCVVVTLLNPDNGNVIAIETGELVYATGLGDPKPLPGTGKALTIKDLLRHESPHKLGETVAIIGDRDSALMAFETILDLIRSRRGMPRGEHELKEIIWVRPSGLLYKETFGAGDERNRYATVADFLPRLLDPDYPALARVMPGRVISTDGKVKSNEFTVKNGDKLDVNYADTLINVTGFSNPLAKRFDPDNQDVSYHEGVPIARVIGKGVTVVGPAAQLPVSEREFNLYPILRERALRVNSVALFRNNAAADTLARLRARGKGFLSMRASLGAKARSTNRISSARNASTFRRSFSFTGETQGEIDSLEWRLRLLVATYSEGMRIGTQRDRIVLRITTEPPNGILVVSEADVPKALTKKVLSPVFNDKIVQRMLVQKCHASDWAVSKLENVLPNKKRMKLTPSWSISIPLEDGMLVPEALTLTP